MNFISILHMNLKKLCSVALLACCGLLLGCATISNHQFETSGYVFERDRPSVIYLRPTITTSGKAVITKQGEPYQGKPLIEEWENQLSVSQVREISAGFAKIVQPVLRQTLERTGLRVVDSPEASAAIASLHIDSGHTYCHSNKRCGSYITVRLNIEGPNGRQIWSFVTTYSPHWDPQNTFASSSIEQLAKKLGAALKQDAVARAG